MKQHYTIPIFIPEKACPFRCVYCNQYHIADLMKPMEPEAIISLVESYLETIPKHALTRVAFFGGSFTGMSILEQKRYLQVVSPYLERGDISGIQLSTRPDYINSEILQLLKDYGVSIIELGAQSLDDEVLRAAGRGHIAAEVQQASSLILEKGFQLGLQMMIGLPGDTFEKSLDTAQKIIEWGAHYTRIYPALVIRDTELEEMYLQKKYTPLTLEEAVNWCRSLMALFTANNVTILRMGLHPSEGLLTGHNLVAGPFHVSFKELVQTAHWSSVFDQEIQSSGTQITVKINPKQLNSAVGYYGKNKKWLQQKYNKVIFQEDESLLEWDYKIEITT